MAEVERVWKVFGGRSVVQDVTFDLASGEILGLVGPNGAGKTTTIRMLMDIIRPDRGQVRLFGAPFCAAHRRMLGYLPEERGLYRGLRVLETLVYLGSLKGLAGPVARRRAEAVLERVGMSAHRNARVGELSRGMAQLIQFAATVLHQPRMLVMDEPFTGLDPVNTRLLREVLLEMRREGTAVILSTHQMGQVEELCDRVLMINQGRVVLYGAVEEVRAGYGRGSVLLRCDRSPDGLPGIERVVDHGPYYELVLAADTGPQRVLEVLVARGVAVERFEVASLPLEEIFIRVVEAGR